MREGKDPKKEGAFELGLLQRYLNLWFSLSEDLFGGEISSNAADFFAAGLKGRYKESQYQDHKVLDGHYDMDVMEEGKLLRKQIPLRTAMNEVLRDNYIEDCQRAVDKWNRTLEKLGVSERLALPHRRFHRQQGIYAGSHFAPDGRLLDSAEWEREKQRWLPSEADQTYVETLMRPVTDIGKIASWIAPPSRGVNGQSFEFEYVRL
jgi:benzoyl-CoA 2,3-dioxygenase component B